MMAGEQNQKKKADDRITHDLVARRRDEWKQELENSGALENMRELAQELRAGGQKGLLIVLSGAAVIGGGVAYAAGMHEIAAAAVEVTEEYTLAVGVGMAVGGTAVALRTRHKNPETRRRNHPWLFRAAAGATAAGAFLGWQGRDDFPDSIPALPGRPSSEAPDSSNNSIVRVDKGKIIVTLPQPCAPFMGDITQQDGSLPMFVRRIEGYDDFYMQLLGDAHPELEAKEVHVGQQAVIDCLPG
jgi:hypothetical protein